MSSKVDCFDKCRTMQSIPWHLKPALSVYSKSKLDNCIRSCKLQIKKTKKKQVKTFDEEPYVSTMTKTIKEHITIRRCHN